MKQLILAFICTAALALAATPEPADVKVALAGVAVCGMNEHNRSARPLPTETRLTVQPGQVALFFLEYSIPPGFKSRIFLTPNGRDPAGGELPFGYSGSAAYAGSGRLMPVLFLMEEGYGEPVLLKSVRLEGELVPPKGAPRNPPFFLRDIPVEILFTKDPDPDPARVVPLKALPPPAAEPAPASLPLPGPPRSE